MKRVLTRGFIGGWARIDTEVGIVESLLKFFRAPE